MRKVPVLLAAAALLLAALPSAASAHAAVRFTDDRTSIFCEGLTGAAGVLNFYADASADFGAFAGLDFWADPASPQTDPPTWTAGDSQVALGPDGLTLTGTIDVYEFASPEPEPEPEPGAIVPQATGPGGPYVGQATVDIALEPTGDPVPFSERGGKGTNQQFRLEGTDQWFAVSGVIVLPGEITYADLSSCMAVREVVNIFATQPDAYVSRTSSIGLGCEWTDADRYVYLNAYAESGWAYADLFVSTAGGDYYGGADAVLTSSAFSATFDLYTMLPPEPEAIRPNATGGEELVGSAEASATLTATGDRVSYMQNDRTLKFKVHASMLSVDGSLSLSLPEGDVTLSTDDAVCSASSQRVQLIQTSPNGQPRVKPLPNDLPGDATAIAVGASVSVRSTAGTAIEPEAPCTFVDPEFGPVELPIGHTAWWMFEGTGGDVTVDTAGSTFDTIVGIYTYDGASYTQVACADDVETPQGYSLQAVLTIGTDAGVTYYIQVGGFGGEVGRLELALS